MSLHKSLSPLSGTTCISSTLLLLLTTFPVELNNVPSHLTAAVILKIAEPIQRAPAQWGAQTSNNLQESLDSSLALVSLYISLSFSHKKLADQKIIYDRSEIASMTFFPSSTSAKRYHKKSYLKIWLVLYILKEVRLMANYNLFHLFVIKGQKALILSITRRFIRNAMKICSLLGMYQIFDLPSMSFIPVRSLEGHRVFF